ncbi:polymer-forming cytoskeletal protein [Paenibacillus sp. PSB04]|uniref:polymer-forming cytoskeletal protein n=1 Tax=Paenibacillus sp. PSB04 TaxID=2866810 RepID=UPI0021F15129|nr:hypothetical protein [Paenibacillus sp. PSB04]UYO05174.1 hypothetical protein K2F33_04225 [Paenibacillus sp. PSB04]
MEREQRHDMSMSGIGTVASGVYKTVRIDGISKVKGDIDCITLDSNGTLNISGSVLGETVKINGTMSIGGNLSAERLILDGMGSVKEMTRCSESAAINGQVTLEKGLNSEKVEVSGSLKSKGDVQCEVLSVHGGFNVDGLVNAGEIDLKMSLASKAKEIGGDHITVRRLKKAPILLQLAPVFNNRLKADLIEGDFVDLEYTEADVVRGSEVRIGPGCKIGRVEYKVDFKRDGDAQVGSAKQI